jgi:16S rRNA (cytosine1402-N4)-methyltransferase
MAHIQHHPVLAEEATTYLCVKPDGIYVDATLGSGGHALKILKDNASIKKRVGIDWDEEAVSEARRRLVQFRDKVVIFQDNFAHLADILKKIDVRAVDGMLLDLGVSSFQLERADRGFSFLREGKLDMRMNREFPVTAFDLVNYSPPKTLVRIFYDYGEERWSKRIAQAIERVRKTHPITTTLELATVVEAAIPPRHRPRKIHAATKVFQALRIAVNDELTNLRKILDQGIDLLGPGGRLCVISFHSLEDRIVKETFRTSAKGCQCPPKSPCTCSGKGKIKLITKKPVTPKASEIEVNPRSRSAKLRVAERI